eukprot:945218-Pelagomonas_calceolata.AAC.1
MCSSCMADSHRRQQVVCDEQQHLERHSSQHFREHAAMRSSFMTGQPQAATRCQSSVSTKLLC